MTLWCIAECMYLYDGYQVTVRNPSEGRMKIFMKKYVGCIGVIYVVVLVFSVVVLAVYDSP